MYLPPHCAGIDYDEVDLAAAAATTPPAQGLVQLGHGHGLLHGPTKPRFLEGTERLESAVEYPGDAGAAKFPGGVCEHLLVVLSGGQARAQADGQQLWRRNYDTGFLASAAIEAGLVVIGDIEGNLYAIDAKSGEQRWQQMTDGEINGSVAFHGEHVLVTSQDGKLYCFALYCLRRVAVYVAIFLFMGGGRWATQHSNLFFVLLPP